MPSFLPAVGVGAWELAKTLGVEAAAESVAEWLFGSGSSNGQTIPSSTEVMVPTQPSTNGGYSTTDSFGRPPAGMPAPPRGVAHYRWGGYVYKWMPRTRLRYPNDGERWVKIRRMNPLNPRALMRAHRRAKAFEGFVMRNFSITRRSKVKPKRHRRK